MYMWNLATAKLSPRLGEGLNNYWLGHLDPDNALQCSENLMVYDVQLYAGVVWNCGDIRLKPMMVP